LVFLEDKEVSIFKWRQNVSGVTMCDIRCLCDASGINVTQFV